MSFGGFGTKPATTGVFGGTQPQQQTGLFGQSQQQTGSFFGGSRFFGQPRQQWPAAGGTLFSRTQTQQPQVPLPYQSHGSLFRGPSTANYVPETSGVESAAWCLIKRAFTLPDCSSLIESIFSSEDGRKMVHALCEHDAQSFIDVIDKVLLDVPNLSPLIQKRCLKSLYRTCGRYALLPTAMNVHIRYDQPGGALYKGEFADVWKGVYYGQEVAVKVVRTHPKSDSQRVIGKFCKEAVTWRTLQHLNVLPLIGVTRTETQFTMISEWMENGNINEFVKVNPDADRLGLLGDVARGLIYIHSQGMVHGDLKGANVLIDRTRHARLADFGLLTIVSDPTNVTPSSSYTRGGTARWMSPELINPQRFGVENSCSTEPSDCYALAMVIYEVISGHLPFYEYADLTVITEVLEGGRPLRGVDFADSLWEMLELCWMPPPNARPSIKYVLRCLERSPQSGEPPSPVNGDVDDEYDWDLESDSSVDNKLPHPPAGSTS